MYSIKNTPHFFFLIYNCRAYEYAGTLGITCLTCRSTGDHDHQRQVMISSSTIYNDSPVNFIIEFLFLTNLFLVLGRAKRIHPSVFIVEDTFFEICETY